MIIWRLEVIFKIISFKIYASFVGEERQVLEAEWKNCTKNWTFFKANNAETSPEAIPFNLIVKLICF